MPALGEFCDHWTLSSISASVSSLVKLKIIAYSPGSFEIKESTFPKVGLTVRLRFYLLPLGFPTSVMISPNLLCLI